MMAKVSFVSCVLALLFMCLCLGGGPSQENGTASTTESVTETTATPGNVTTTTWEFSMPTEPVTSTTYEYEWPIDWETNTTLLNGTTRPVATTTTLFTKRANGLPCLNSSECVYKNCIDGVCCKKGQCAFDGKCYDLRVSRPDGRVCIYGIWKKGFGSHCTNSTECLTNYCIDQTCCTTGQCSYGKICYNTNQVRYDKTMTCAGGGIWKRSVGQSCSTKDDCINKVCTDGHCCGTGQCYYKSACYSRGARTYDSLYVCMQDGELKVREEKPCGSDDECSTGYCKDGFCCKSTQCGYNNDCYDSGDTSAAGVCRSGVWEDE